MEYRQLGGSGLKVSALSFGTATFGGGDAFFSAWGNTDVAEAQSPDRYLPGGRRHFVRYGRYLLQQAYRKRFLARPSQNGETRCLFQRRQPSAWAMVLTTWVPRAIT